LVSIITSEWAPAAANLLHHTKGSLRTKGIHATPAFRSFFIAIAILVSTVNVATAADDDRTLVQPRTLRSFAVPGHGYIKIVERTAACRSLAERASRISHATDPTGNTR
jgi:hypothetical protein